MVEFCYATHYDRDMRRTSFERMNCSVARCLEVIGEWWTPLLLRDLFLGVSRFDDFQTRTGIARNILADRLARLVEAGVVEKVRYQDHPERFDYRLTEKGQDLWRVIAAMREWGDAWETGPDGPPLQMLHLSCGRVTTTVPTCAECGERVERGDVRMVDGPGTKLGSQLPVSA
jgi:DNA-binding HxlR family transcriptional regulator